MRKLALMSGLFAMLGAAPALAVAAVAGQNMTQSPPSTALAKPTPWISLTSAQDIAGRMLSDPQGRAAGRIQSVVIDLEKGTAIYALIGSAGGLDIGNDYAAVPFSTLHLNHDEDVMNVSLSVGRIAIGPRFEPSRLGELGEPDRLGEIYGSYSIPTPHGYVPSHSLERDDHPGRFVLVRPGDIVRLDVNSALAQDIRDETVKAANGDIVGKIDRIMIDPAGGRVAYLLLLHGGFLGIGQKWVPIPAQAIAWSTPVGGYVLKDSVAQPEQVAGSARSDDNLVTQVRRDQLQSLYECYGVTPYWQEEG